MAPQSTVRRDSGASVNSCTMGPPLSRRKRMLARFCDVLGLVSST